MQKAIPYPLHDSIWANDMKKLFLQLLKPVDINKLNQDNATPIILAAQQKNNLACWILLNDPFAKLYGENRLDINYSPVKIDNCDASYSMNCYTLLTIAIQTNNAELVSILINDNRIDINMPDAWGKYPSDYVYEEGNSDIISIFLHSHKLDSGRLVESEGGQHIKDLLESKLDSDSNFHPDEFHENLVKHYDSIFLDYVLESIPEYYSMFENHIHDEL